MITIGKYSGFCYGVQNAVETLERNLGEQVYTYGEIIHNPIVVGHFAEKGVGIINNPKELECGTIVIRSHGAKKCVIDTFLQKGIKVIDATCKFVKKIHEIVYKKHAEGYRIIIVGQADHPEVVGINGWCDESGIVVANEGEFLAALTEEKTCIVVQTTYEKDKFLNILKNIPKRYINLVEIFDTICYTTIKRQNEAEVLSRENDIMLVIGGKKSSNTKKLYDIARRNCSEVYMVESIDELDFVNIDKTKKIGVVAGASTPNGLIKEVFLKMANIEEKVTMEDIVNAMDNNGKLKKGQVISATISDVNDDGLMVSIPSYKADFAILKDEVCYNEEYVKTDFELGDEIKVRIIAVSPIKLSRRAVEAEEVESKQVLELWESKQEFAMTFNESNKGGLIGRFGNCSVFVPASQIRLGFITEVDKYKGKPLRLEITEYDAEKKKVIASQRIILEREKSVKELERSKKEEAFWGEISEGQIVEGKVVRISDFGAFVSVNGFDCLAHKSDLSWTPVAKVEDVLEKNKVYNFRVLKTDPDTKKVSLGYKQLQEHPWEKVAQKYAQGSVVSGRVARLVPFGAFIELESGIDGLVHVSQICHEWIERPEEKLVVGDIIEAKVLEVIPESQKITLSIKALTEAPERPAKPRDERFENALSNMERKTFAPKFDNSRPRAKKPVQKQDEKGEGASSWSDSSSSASIGDMLKAFNLEIEEK